MKWIARIVCSFVLLLAVATGNTQDYGNYAGKGGMKAHKIESHVYEYHYDHGFSDEDAMGWDPDLQFAWSRLAAAKACNIEHGPQAAVIDHLIQSFGQSESVHEIVGIGFHLAQIQFNPSFCTSKRKAEIVHLMPEYDRGSFPVSPQGFDSRTEEAGAADVVSDAASSTEEISSVEVAEVHADPGSSVPPVSTALLLPFSYRTGNGENGRESGDGVLRVVRRAHAGRAAGLQVLSSALLGGVSGVGFGKSQLHGEKINSIPNPGQDVLQTALRSKLDEYFSLYPEKLPSSPLPLNVSGHDWVLMYQELTNSDTSYELRYSAYVSGPSKKTGFLRFEPSPVALECRPTPKVASLEEWELDDYAAVRVAASEYAAQCSEDFERRLATWFQAPSA